MLKAIQFALRYRPIIPVLIEFVETCVRSASDKQLTKKEKSALMTQYWKVVRAIQAIK